MSVEIEEIRKLLCDGDSFAAAERIQREGTPLEIGDRYDRIARELYWKAKDLPAVVAVARAGIFYCLSQSLVSGEAAGQLRQHAKHLAYNAGSFTWPGWGEAGIDPSPADVAFGMDCARLNLRLAIELNRPPMGLSNAHWLIGAHAMAVGDFDRAAKEFQLAREGLSPENESEKALDYANAGYWALARLCKSPGDGGARAAFDEAVAELDRRGGEECGEYAQQIRTAREVFAAVG